MDRIRLAQAIQAKRRAANERVTQRVSFEDDDKVFEAECDQWRREYPYQDLICKRWDLI